MTSCHERRVGRAAVSDIPFPVPVGAVRIGKVEGNFVVNPTEEQLQESDLDLVVSGTDEAILMVEAGANEIPEAEILDALDIAHSEIRKLVAVQRELAEKAGKAKQEIEVPQVDEDLARQIAESHGAALDAATQVEDKLERQAATKEVEDQVLVQYSGDPAAGDVRRVPPEGAAGVRRAREEAHPRAHRGPQEAPGRPPAGRDPADRHPDQAAAAHARLGALHPRPDAGPLRGRPRHHARGDAAGQPRARDVQALLPPLQLPAVLGRRGRLHARPQAA